MAPIIGITCDTALPDDGAPRDSRADASVPDFRYTLPSTYARAVTDAGGIPVLLPHQREHIDDYLDMCSGFVLAGGDDPDTAPFGEPVHSEAKLIHPQRQRFEIALLAALDSVSHPVLGICLGMQMMALHHGGRLDQHLPDTLGDAAAKHDRQTHTIRCPVDDHPVLPPTGAVYSRHHQAISDTGAMRVCAVAEDGVIEACDLAGTERLYLGVQWHPERTQQAALGLNIYRSLCAACAV